MFMLSRAQLLRVAVPSSPVVSVLPKLHAPQALCKLSQQRLCQDASAGAAAHTAEPEKSKAAASATPTLEDQLSRADVVLLDVRCVALQSLPSTSQCCFKGVHLSSDRTVSCVSVLVCFAATVSGMQSSRRS